jgi:hypothetical protein
MRPLLLILAVLVSGLPASAQLRCSFNPIVPIVMLDDGTTISAVGAELLAFGGSRTLRPEYFSRGSEMERIWDLSPAPVAAGLGGGDPPSTYTACSEACHVQYSISANHPDYLVAQGVTEIVTGHCLWVSPTQECENWQHCAGSSWVTVVVPSLGTVTSWADLNYSEAWTNWGTQTVQHTMRMSYSGCGETTEWKLAVTGPPPATAELCYIEMNTSCTTCDGN